MSELMNTWQRRKNQRWQLLATVSGIALLAVSYGATDLSAADDGDRPTVWVELDGQLVHVDGQGDRFAPAFLKTYPQSVVLRDAPNPLQAQNPSPFAFGEGAKISFRPEESNWEFSIGLTYGRSNNFKDIHHQTTGTHHATRSNVPNHVFSTENYVETQSRRDESHAIVDFSVGKDVGLGMFGKSGSSVVSVGVRFAQFESKQTLDMRARPDVAAKYFTSAPKYIKVPLMHFHSYHVTGIASRNVRGLGPSLSWKNSTPLLGEVQTGELSLDWGVNAALLFGKQKAVVRHHETAQYAAPLHHYLGNYYAPVYQRSGGHTTDRSIVSPNVGGIMGASYRIENFKVSAGYRADFFFGAIDGGIDTRKSENVGFLGPFLSISVGLGD